MATIPKVMRAWTYNARGLPRDVLRFTPDHPAPAKPKDNEVTVKITHAAMNPSGHTLMNLIPWVFSSKPAIPELDLAGVVVEAGKSATAEFQTGRPVLGFIPANLYFKGTGALAEYVTLPINQLTPKPNDMGWQEAAGLSATGQTAIQMVRTANVQAGQRVLLNGASSGVGLFVLQIAKAMNANVTATCSHRNIELIRSLGADEIIDYTKHESLPRYLADTFKSSPFDAILDCIGAQDLYDSSPAYLKSDSMLVNIGNYADGEKLRQLLNVIKNTMLPTWLGGTPRKYGFFAANPNGEGSAEIVKMIQEGSIRCVIDREYAMEEVLEAYDYLMTKRAKGKVIIRIQEP